MKEWWLNLSLREKQTVSLGAGVLAAILIYLILWAPLSYKVNQLRSTLQHSQQLLVWMQKTDQQIQTLQKISKKSHSFPTTASLLSLIQNQINQSPLAKNLSQLKQADNDTVQVSFQQIEFDKLISWLIQVWQQHGLILTQIAITPSGPPGIVTAEFILKQG